MPRNDDGDNEKKKGRHFSENPKSWYHFFEVVVVGVWGIRWSETLRRHVPPNNPLAKFKREEIVAKLKRVYPWFNDWETYYDSQGTAQHERKTTKEQLKGVMTKRIWTKTVPRKHVYLYLFTNVKHKKGATEFRIGDMVYFLWHLDETRMKIEKKLAAGEGDPRFINVIP